jgi:hypothetical protein
MDPHPDGELWELERLKQLKARYCRLLDTKDWAAWRTLFTDDFRSDTTPAGGLVVDGADAFVAYTRRTLGDRATVHQVHAPELTLTSPATAEGIWALEDVVRLAPGVNLRAYGHYRETYVLVDGGWLIATSTLTRLREDVFNIGLSIYLSGRVKRTLAGVSRRAARKYAP